MGELSPKPPGLRRFSTHFSHTQIIFKEGLMPRVKLEERPCDEFCHLFTLRVTDLSDAHHLGNDGLVSLVHEARANLMESLGCAELDLGDRKTGFIMADLVVNYLQRGFLFDELNIEAHIGDVSRKSFRIYYRISKANSLLALVETGMVAYNYTERKAVPLPKVFVQAIKDAGHL